MDMERATQEQIVMSKPDSSLVFFYSEGIIQFGMIVLFAVSFPLAPLFSMITNIIEINVKMNQMTQFSRRRIA